MAISIPNKQEILVLDYDTKKLFEKNPEDTEPLTQKKKYEIILKDDLEFGDYFVKRNSNLIPIKNLPEDENLYLVYSELRNNLFFPLKDFQILYRDEIKAVLFALAMKMGAKSYEFEFYEEEINLEERKKTLETGVGGSFKKISAEAKASIEKKENSDEKRFAEKLVKGNFPNNKAVSKEKLQQFIDEENINLNALPPEFAGLIRCYDGTSQIGGNLEQTEKLTTSLQKSAKFLVDMSLNGGVADFLRAGVEANFISESETSYSFYSKIRWKLEF
ncbi:hypothetical protein OFO07_01080 [Campylobacter sp. JMF_06 NA1]|uniref:hypothetical protein n=1 Tax=Campylobacter sp. JMF_06 NA1 TaxID=2983823 RepID=UPI0022E9C503|nr:hypothetical protein [Campylobacter sp. JMF_06 NA1]MDA3077516.1 hypothetical protein [Campylobacter sp. JMF_06 NA1]